MSALDDYCRDLNVPLGKILRWPYEAERKQTVKEIISHLEVVDQTIRELIAYLNRELERKS